MTVKIRGKDIKVTLDALEVSAGKILPITMAMEKAKAEGYPVPDEYVTRMTKNPFNGAMTFTFHQPNGDEETCLTKKVAHTRDQGSLF